MSSSVFTCNVTLHASLNSPGTQFPSLVSSNSNSHLYGAVFIKNPYQGPTHLVLIRASEENDNLDFMHEKTQDSRV